MIIARIYVSKNRGKIQQNKRLNIEKQFLWTELTQLSWKFGSNEEAQQQQQLFIDTTQLETGTKTKFWEKLQKGNQ